MNDQNPAQHRASTAISPTGMSRQAWAFGLAGLSAGLLVAVGIWIGRSPAPSQTNVSQDAAAIAERMMLDAGAAAANDAFAVCTGPVSDGEGLFMLDFVTGELTCVVLHPRTGKFLARFSTNIVANFPTDATKKPRYLLTAGAMDFRGGGAANRFGQSIIYVIDANTGTFAAYGIPWNNNLWNNGSPMMLQLTLLDAGRARSVAIGE